MATGFHLWECESHVGPYVTKEYGAVFIVYNGYNGDPTTKMPAIWEEREIV